ncbi:MAG: hypothetical protein ABL876_05325 [Chitinophagaceae bacterium]
MAWWHWGAWLRTCGNVLVIPFKVTRNYIGKKAMAYMKKVKARAGY